MRLFALLFVVISTITFADEKKPSLSKGVFTKAQFLEKLNEYASAYQGTWDFWYPAEPGPADWWTNLRVGMTNYREVRNAGFKGNTERADKFRKDARRVIDLSNELKMFPLSCIPLTPEEEPIDANEEKLAYEQMRTVRDRYYKLRAKLDKADSDVHPLDSPIITNELATEATTLARDYFKATNKVREVLSLQNVKRAMIEKARTAAIKNGPLP